MKRNQIEEKLVAFPEYEGLSGAMRAGRSGNHGLCLQKDYVVLCTEHQVDASAILERGWVIWGLVMR